MKKLSLLFFLFFFTRTFAATGWYQDYIKLDVNNNGVSGPTGWFWIGGNPSYATELNGTNLGVVSSLKIADCDMRYWSDSQDRTGGAFYYKIMSSDGNTEIKATVETIWTQAFLGGNNYQGTKTANINILDGLKSSTAYKLHIWAKSWGSSQGDNWLTNSGANYVATFTTQSAETDYFRSKTTGNWNTAATWESSNDNTIWTPSTLAPTNSAASVTVMAGHKVNIDANITIGTLVVLNTGTLEVNTGKQLTVGTSLTNNGIINLLSDATGTATILTPGSSNISGTFKVQQYLSSARNWYVSSPVTGATVPASKTYYKYDETGSNSTFVNPATLYWVSTVQATTLLPMVGYIAKPDAASTIEFSGTLNNGNKSVALTRTIGKTKEGFNLVGNPYPSHLVWTTDVATAANTSSSIWYRTYSSGYIFQTYNAAGTVAVPIEATPYIPPMQGFWVRVNVGGGTLSLTNAMRYHKDANPLKVPNAKNITQKTLRLTVSDGTNIDETLIYTNPNAVDAFDTFDSQKMSNGSTSGVPEIYTVVGDEQLVINGMNSLPLETEIPLGFTTNQSLINSFTFKATELSNFDADARVILKDNLNLLNPETDITDGTAYTFSSDATATTSRFSIKFKSSGSMSRFIEINDQKVSVHKDANNQISIDLKQALNSPISISVYNSTGQKISTVQSITQKTVIGQRMAKGIYVVAVHGNGLNATRKIIIN